MANFQLVNGRFFDQAQQLSLKSIEISDGLISSLNGTSSGTVIDLKGKILTTALFDTHINGGEKHYFTKDLSLEALADMESATAKTGTGYFLPCIITCSLENILTGIDVLKAYMALNPHSGALGLHLEGPFLNLAKRGAHMAKYIQKPSMEALKQIIEKGRDIIKIMTIAPEVFDADSLKYLIDSGIKLSAGHSNARFSEAKSAFKNGISLCTHLFNAMSPLGHREPGLVGAVLHTKTVFAPIIVDNTHVSYSAVELAYQLKPDHLFLISDALFVNRKVKNFQWENFDAQLINDQYVNSEGNLAGASLSLAECVANAVHYCNIPLEAALEMAASRPFRALGLTSPSLAIGQKAKFTVFSEDLKEAQFLNLT